MSLLVKNSGTSFDGTRMTDEFGSNGIPATPGGRDKIAGATELGVGKSVCGGIGETRRVDILLKTKVVLEKDATSP